MIRNFLRLIAVNSLGIFLASKINSQLFIFTGDYKILIYTGLVIVFVNLLVRPIINLLLLPIHILTLGTFRWITNLIIIFLITKIVPQFSIGSFISGPLNISFIIIPPVYFSAFGAYLLASFILTLIFQLLYWLFEV